MVSSAGGTGECGDLAGSGTKTFEKQSQEVQCQNL